MILTVGYEAGENKRVKSLKDNGPRIEASHTELPSIRKATTRADARLLSRTRALGGGR